MKKSREKSEIRTGRHSFFFTPCSFCLCDKIQKKVFLKKHLKYMEEILKKICKYFKCELKEFNGEEDYVYLLNNYLTKVTLSKLVNSLKEVSSRKLRQKYPELKKYYWKGPL